MIPTAQDCNDLIIESQKCAIAHDWEGACTKLRQAILICPMPIALPAIGAMLVEAETNAKPKTLIQRILAGVGA